MDEQDLGDWDEVFLEAAIKAEEFHLSSQMQSQPPPAPATAPSPSPAMPTISSFLSHAPQPQPQPPVQRHDTPARDHLLSYSPPRELSQRVAGSSDAFQDRSNSAVPAKRSSAVPAKRSSPCSTSRRSDSAKDMEIDRLKKELGSVSRQLLDLEQECSQLRKERDKETKTWPSHTENNVQDADVYGSKRPNLESGFAASVNDGASHEAICAKGFEDDKCLKAIGVQADLPNCVDLSKKLLDIWSLSSYQDLAKNLIPELMVACSTDFHILFSFMNTDNIASPVVGELGPENSLTLQRLEAFEAAKVPHLYSAITKISYGMLDLKAFFEPLLDLCKAKNAAIVHTSLHILHVLLKHICGVETKHEYRDNVTDVKHNSGYIPQFRESQSRGQPSLNGGESATSGHISFWPRSATGSCKRGPGDAENAQLLGHIGWLSLFKLMNQIANRRTEEHVKLEAVSIMKIIVMRSDAYTERESFGSAEVFENLSLLLKKEAGLYVRKQAVHLLYLLLNCPKLLAIIDSPAEEGKIPSTGNGNEQNLLASKAFGMIFEGLADCLASSRKTSEDLELCRLVVMVLAFLASSGNSGFEVLTTHNLSQDTNFLMLILQLLVAEIDSETTTASPQPAETFKARTLLMREILILLNRLVSGASSSSTILRELTKSRDMASLTIDAATRLSRKRRIFGQPDSAAQRMRESEITDLARIFKRRIFAYLGDTMS